MWDLKDFTWKQFPDNLLFFYIVTPNVNIS